MGECDGGDEKVALRDRQCVEYITEGDCVGGWGGGCCVE